MDKLNEVKQATSLWNVLRTASAWISKAPDGVASVTSPLRNNAIDKEAVDGDGMAEQAELVASHVLDATKNVLADLREQIVEARSELQGVNSELAEKKAELAATENEVADAALRREIASADAEFLAWQRQELEPKVDGLQREWESLREKIRESKQESAAAEVELRTQKEKMEMKEADLASKLKELATLKLVIDEAARKKRAEQETIEMLAEERDKTEQGIQKLKRDHRALSAELLDIELDILEKGDELEELKPLHDFHKKRQRGVARERGVLGKYARYKAECLAREKEIKELEKELVSAEESNLALSLEKRDLEAALRERTPVEESQNEKKLAEYRTNIAECCKQMTEFSNSMDAFFMFLRLFGRQMHQTAVACLSEETSADLRSMLETMAAEATGFKEAVHGRKGPHTMGTAMAEASIGCKKQMELLRRELQCLSEMEQGSEDWMLDGQPQ